MNFLKRLQEPSTHAALASLATLGAAVAVQSDVDTHTVTAVGTAASALFALLGVFMPEKAA
jgi:hypothetical protein